MIDNLFLSVGAMKAGTTWLYEQLKSHPDVYFTPEKEIHYFANKVGIEHQLDHKQRVLKLKAIMEKYHNSNAKHIAENMDEIAWYLNFANSPSIDNDWYISLFETNTDSKYCADFSNLYCQMDDDGWRNVLDLARNTKVIYTLRDPLKRIWSHYKFHHKWIGKEDNVLDDGFDLFKETLHKSWFYNNIDYAGNLKKIKKNISDSNLLLLYFEDFRSNPQEQADNISQFLEIEPIFIPESTSDVKVNSTKDFPMPEEWKEYAEEFISPYKDEMKRDGIIHSSWSF